MLRIDFSYVLMMYVQLSYLENYGYGIVLYGHVFTTRFIDSHFQTI